MSPIKRIGLLAGVGALALSGASFADTTVDDQNDALRARIAELENRLAAVEANNGDNWLTEQRAAEVRALVEDVLADADTRSSMMAQGMSMGYQDGAFVGNDNWNIKTNLLLQTRFMLNARRFPSPDPGGVATGLDNTTWGFEVTRAKFMLSGHVVDPTWYYRVDIETTTNAAGLTTAAFSDARTGVLNAYIGKDFENGWKVAVGQFKAPLLYGDFEVEAQNQQAVERSYLTYLYTGSYTQGVLVTWETDQIRLNLSYNNGINDIQYGGGVTTAPGVGGSTGAALATDTKYSFTGRVDWLAMGTWDQFKQYTSPKGEEMGVMVGGAVQFQSGEGQISQVTGGIQDSLLVFTVDASAKFGGANVYGMLVYSNMDPAEGTPGVGVANPWGFQIGGGVYLDDTLEAFGLYEWSDLDVPGTNDLSMITVGVNKYIDGQHAKWTTDFGWGLDSVPFNIPVTGWMADVGGEEGQFLLRSQLQILF